MKRRAEKGDKREKTSPSDVEVEYFERAMADVVRLAPDPRPRVRAAPQISAPHAAPPSTSSASVASVIRFIDTGRHRHRCVCIVHGRGLHSQGNVSILKRRVRECLRQHRAVLAYADAPRADGGTGAVYVLLRK